MALTKVTYVDGKTIITAANLNAIQDEIISQESRKSEKTATVSNVTYDETTGKFRKTINGTTSDIITADSSPTSGSKRPVQSGGVYTALAALKGSLNAVCLRAAVKTISGNGTSSNTLTGLTANHVVGDWGMFSDANCTTPIPENSPPCDITITTAANAWSVTIANYSSTFYLRPTFILKQN